jgi:hypothetical protein
MGEILGLGGTHYPSLVASEENMLSLFHTIVDAPRVDPRWKDRANWPPEMIAELDEGMTAVKRYRARMWDNFRKLRKMLDDFAPDFLIIFGDDQYENFKEDIIPPFCIFGLDDDFDQQPYKHGFMSRFPNGWGEPKDWTLRIHGHRNGAKYLTRGLLERGVPMPYAYKPLHIEGLGHAFTYTVMYLDCDRKGFPHPVIPFDVNCYGSQVITSGGAIAHLFNEPKVEGLPDPPGPSPALCMEVGAKLAQVAAASPYRIAMMASSSWSHCFLSPNTGFVIPDHKSDRLLFEALKKGDYEVWRRRTTEETERAGHQEMLNWMVLAGAMAELKRKPVIHDYVETYIFQSNKCFCSFPPSVSS